MDPNDELNVSEGIPSSFRDFLWISSVFFLTLFWKIKGKSTKWLETTANSHK